MSIYTSPRVLARGQLSAVPDHHLYDLGTPLTPLVGREREMDTVRALLRRADVRLVTLTGPPGAGKTRLAQELAAALVGAFERVVFVSLAAIREPALVLPAIARPLGVQESGGRPLANALYDYLAPRRLLLVLDNFEQVVDAAPRVAELLAACAGVTALITSRTALGVRGEFEAPVLSLPLPPEDLRHDLDVVARSPAVELFVQRCQAVCPDFRLDEGNVRAVAEVCARLDGLPLAIELAAPRIRLLTPETLVARLINRFALLTGGARDLPSRHRSLRAAISWSYDLLSTREQQLFRQMAVFAGGWTLAAAEAVAPASAPAPPEPDDSSTTALDLLASLVAQSLVRVKGRGLEMEAASTTPLGGDEPRFEMLESIRDFAWEALVAGGEMDAVQRAHAAYCLALAEQAHPHLFGADQTDWLERLDRDHENIRAALEWSIARGDAETALRLGVALRRFWLGRGYIVHGRRLLERALATGGAVAPEWRGEALDAAGELAWVEGDDVAAERLFSESLAIRRALGDYVGIGWTLNYLGLVARRSGDGATARARFDEALALGRRFGETRQIGHLLHNLGDLAYDEGELDAARTLLGESLDVFRSLDDRTSIAMALSSMGEVVAALGESAPARGLIEEGVALAIELGDRRRLAALLANLAAVAATEHPERAVQLAGAAAALRDAVGVRLPERERARFELRLAPCRRALDETTFAARWLEGQAMSRERIIDLALAEAREQPPEVAAPPAVTAPPAAPGDELTRRELEVLRLLAGGCSNQVIADMLVVSVRTVEHHVSNIYEKIGVRGRAAATAYAFHHQLVPASPSSSPWQDTPPATYK